MADDGRASVVLLLEDEGLIALDVQGTLEEAGFAVTSFPNCSGAAAWLQDHTPDLVVLDMHLTDGSCRHIAQMLVERDIPFIVHTGEIEGDHQDTAFARGKWLAKPSHDAELIALARTVARGA